MKFRKATTIHYFFANFPDIGFLRMKALIGQLRVANEEPFFFVPAKQPTASRMTHVTRPIGSVKDNRSCNEISKGNQPETVVVEEVGFEDGEIGIFFAMEPNDRDWERGEKMVCCFVRVPIWAHGNEFVGGRTHARTHADTHTHTHTHVAGSDNTTRLFLLFMPQHLDVDAAKGLTCAAAPVSDLIEIQFHTHTQRLR